MCLSGTHFPELTAERLDLELRAHGSGSTKQVVRGGHKAKRVQVQARPRLFKCAARCAASEPPPQVRVRFHIEPLAAAGVVGFRARASSATGSIPSTVPR